MLLKKTLKLLSILDKKQRLLLQRELAAANNPRLVRLHDFCMKKSVVKLQESKIAIFKAVFKGMYSDKKDYLLRNEIRLYNEAIKEIIAWSQLKRDKSLLRKAYINGLKDRKLHEFLQKELSLEIRNSLNSQDYAAHVYYMDSLSQLGLDIQNYNSNNFLEIKETVLKTIESIHFHWNDLLSEAFLKLAYTERVLLQLTQETSSSNFEILRKPESISNYARYNYLKARSYDNKDPDRIDTLKMMIELLKEVDHPKISNNIGLGISYASLALEYLMNTNYKEAVLSFEKASAFRADLNRQQWGNVSLNYLSSLCKMGDFQKARIFCEDNQELFLDNETFSYRILPNVIGVYIMTEEVEKAESLLPLNFKDGDLDSYHYFRLLQAIIHFENDLLELAENELLNLRKHLYSLDKEKYVFTIDLTQLILSLVSSKFSKLSDEYETWLLSFKKELVSLTEKYEKFQIDGILFSWLKKNAKY